MNCSILALLLILKFMFLAGRNGWDGGGRHFLTGACFLYPRPMKELTQDDSRSFTKTPFLRDHVLNYLILCSFCFLFF